MSAYLDRRPRCREEVLAVEYRRLANMAEAMDEPNQAQLLRQWADDLDAPSQSSMAELAELLGRMQEGPI